jgi:AsmA protein
VVVQLALKSPALKGELRGSSQVTPDLETVSIAFTDMDLGYKGDAPGASGIDLSLKGALDYHAAKGAIEAKALALRVSANTGNVKLVDSTLQVERLSHDPSHKRYAFRQLQLRISGTQGGKPLALQLDWPELDLSATTLKGSPFNGKLSLGGDVPVEAAFTSGAPSGNFDNVRIPSFETRVDSHWAARKLNATFRTDLVLQPQKQALAFDKISIACKLDDPALKPLSLALQGQAGASARSARWNLAGHMNASPFRTEGTANLSAATPSLAASARFEVLDLNTVVPAAPAGAPASSSAAADPDATVDLSALRLVNGSLTLRAGSVALRQFSVTDLALDATLGAGVLHVNTLQGKTWGGTIDASAVADAGASRVGIKTVASGVDLKALLKDLANKDILEGKGRVLADLETTGSSVAQMKSQLKGSAAVQVRDGAFKGFNLAKSLRQAKAALVTSQDTTQRTDRTEKTDFSEMSASFLIDRGVARSNDLDMKSPYIRVGGVGAVDVGKSRIDYTARATITDTSKGQDGSDLAALRGLTIPVKLSGPLDAIDWNIQWSAVAVGALKNRAESKLKNMLGMAAGAASSPESQAHREQARDRLREKLKGLVK